MFQDPQDSKGMLRITLGQRTLGLQFRHLSTKAMVRGIEQQTRLTYCGVYELPEDPKVKPTKITFGVAKCSGSDNFSREIGRKISLTRALLSGTHEFSTTEAKGTREVIWNAYRMRGTTSFTETPPVVQQQEVIEGIVLNEQKLLEAPVSTVH